MFHRLIARQARRTFAAINARDDDMVLASALPDMRHRFGGEHALGGERHDAAHVRLWFERLHRVVPTLTITVRDVWVHGGHPAAASQDLQHRRAHVGYTVMGGCGLSVRACNCSTRTSPWPA